MTVEHYVEFLYPGSLFPEESAVKIPNPRDLDYVIKHLPRGVFAFTFYDLQIREGRLEDGERITDRKRINQSARFYPDAEAFTAEQLRLFDPQEFRILLSNMECNGWSRVIRTRMGNWQPLQPDDRLISTAHPETPTTAEQHDPTTKDPNADS